MKKAKCRDAVNRTRTTAPPARRTTTILHPEKCMIGHL